MNTKNLVTAFKIVAVVEALTWIGLLTGMFFKYARDIETATKVPGWIHGAAFVVLVALTLLVARAIKWDVKTLALGLIATVVPFCSVVFEVWAQRAGKLDVTAVASKQETAGAIGG